MGLFTSERARRDGRVTFVQLVTGVAGFLLFSVMGGVLLAGLALPAVTVAGQATNGTAKLFESLPADFQQTDLPQASSIYASDGTTLLATFYDQNRVVVPLEDISPWIQIAQVDVEDKRFWQHNGVDGEGLVRVGYQLPRGTTVKRAHRPSPSSSSRTPCSPPPRTFRTMPQRQAAIKDATETTITRKVREWRLALAYEEKLNKKWGTHCTADPKVDCGKERDSRAVPEHRAVRAERLRGRDGLRSCTLASHAKDLNAIEAATIAGITQNPTQVGPDQAPGRSQDPPRPRAADDARPHQPCKPANGT